MTCAGPAPDRHRADRRGRGPVPRLRDPSRTRTEGEAPGRWKATPQRLSRGRDATEPPSTRTRRRFIGRVVLALLTAAALVHPLATLLGRWSWRADLFAHFQIPGLAVTLAALVASARRHGWLAVVLAILAVLQAIPLFRYAGPNPVPPDPRSTARLRILMANVLVDNMDHDDLARLIRSRTAGHRRPGRIHDRLGRRAGRGARGLPVPGRGPVRHVRGLAPLVQRRRPARIEPPECLLARGWPFLHAEFGFAGRSRHLWLVHPRPPHAGGAGAPS